MIAADYGNGQKKTFKYDSWGKLRKAVSEDGKTRRSVYNKYDEFDRLVYTSEAVFENGKAQSGVKKVYAYSPYGQRTALTVTTYGRKGGKMVPESAIKSAWKYDKYGRLAKINKDSDTVEYLYDAKGRVLKRTANAMETYYTYTPLGQLETKSLGALYGKNPIASLKYVYSTDGNIAAREVNGVKQSYKYDKIGQLTAVVNTSGKPVEEYTYDNAGNILKKSVNGEVTTCIYDKANQLVSSTTDGKVTNYEYDAAGRLIKEGNKIYNYGWLDKVLNITENGKVTNSYSYSMDGQLASADVAGKQENFLWDGLALLKRGTTEYVNEPAVTGGNPILANGKMLFNDMLGNSLGVAEKDKFTAIQRNAFGQTLANTAGNDYNLFTGKPKIGGLGYAFLFRNYRPNLGKWQTQDLLGYPDGWNNLAYVNNKVTDCIDWLGADSVKLKSSSISFSITEHPSSTASISVSYSYDYDIYDSNGNVVSAIPGYTAYIYEKAITMNFTITYANGTTQSFVYSRDLIRSSISPSASFVNQSPPQGSSTSYSVTAPGDGRIVSVSVTVSQFVSVGFVNNRTSMTEYFHNDSKIISKSAWAE
jgi:RHS repeat-associated protein